MKNRMLSAHHFPWGALLAGVLLAVHPAWGVRTSDVELGQSGAYDDVAHISRSDAGELIFQDSAVSSASLSQLLGSSMRHGALLDLNCDNHPQYLTGSRHQVEHSADFNSSLPIPVDVGGNGYLGAHVGDSNIHLPRGQSVEITGPWRFSGRPKIWQGLDFSSNGLAGDVSLGFKTDSSDALFQWRQSSGRFAVNRPLRVESDLAVTSSAVVNGDLRVDGVMRGNWAAPPSATEFIQIPFDDNASTSVVRETMRGRSLAFLDSTGNPNTDAHTTAGAVGTALSFDGVDDSISLGQLPCNDILTTGHDFAIAWWWKSPTSNFGSLEMVFCFDYVLRAYNTYSGGINSTYLCMILPDRSATICPVAVGDNDNRWHHYVMQRQGQTDKFFRDGATLLSFTDARTSGAYVPAYYILNGNGVDSRARGSMDDFRIYGRALSDGEVAALYRGGSGTSSPARLVTEIDGTISANQLGVNGRVTSGVLQVSNGAYCNGNTWVTVSSRVAKTGVIPAAPSSEWSKLDDVNVVEFAYRKRNPSRDRWLDPSGNPVEPGSETQRKLAASGAEDTVRALRQQGYHQDNREFLDEPEERRQLGFIAEDLLQADPRLSRGSGVAAIDIVAFDTAVLKEVKKRIVELESRIKTLEAGSK